MEHSGIGSFVARYGGYWRDDVLDFCYLSNPFFPSEETLDELFRELRRAVRFYPSAQKVCAGYLGEYLGLPADWLYVGNGGSECICLVNRLFPGPMLLPVPAFNEYENNRRATGAEVVLFHLTEERGFRLDVERFVEATRTAGVSSAVVTTPNNPTGGVLSRDELAYLWAETRHLDLLLLDESFTNFADVETPRAASSLAALEEHPHVAVLSSMSKDYGIPGLRLGYVASSQPELVTRLARTGPIWNINTMAEIFLERLPAMEAEFERSRVRVIEAVRDLGRGLGACSFLHPAATTANFVFARVSEPFDSTGLVEILFEDHGIFLNDCSNKANLDRRYVRIASRSEEDNATLLRCLSELEGWRPGRPRPTCSGAHRSGPR